MFKVKVAPRAKKELKEIKIQYKFAISVIINDLKEDPYIGKPLNRNLIGKYSYRVGVYRIIYRINLKENLVEIISAGHRSVVYN